LDESGYTGQDLLNKEQPAFSIATLGLLEEECAELKARHFGRVRSAELKYASLSKRPAQQAMVLGFLREILDRAGAVKVSLCHKPFVVLTKMVDLLTETFAHLDGVNLYKDGGNIALSNMLFFGLPVVCGREYYDRLLAAFQDAIRYRTWESFTALRDVLFDPGLTNEQQEWLAWFQGPLLSLGYPLFAARDGEDFEIAFTCGSFLMGAWRRDFPEARIELVHDQSSNMAGLQHVWEFFMSKDRTAFRRDHGRGRSTVFPIGVERTDLAPSESWAGLQLADVVAGAYADGARWAISNGDPTDAYRDQLWHDLLLEAPATLTLWPQLEVDPAKLGTAGSDVSEDLDYVVREMEKAGLTPNWRRRR
jgi:hypothetical protein